MSLHVLIALSQNEYFSAELFNLQKGKDVSVNSSLSMLTPYLDSEGVIRVGGCLRKSHLRHAQKHPVILHLTSQEQTQSFTIKGCTSSVSSYWSTADDIFNQSAISYSVLQTPGKNDL